MAYFCPRIKKGNCYFSNFSIIFHLSHLFQNFESVSDSMCQMLETSSEKKSHKSQFISCNLTFLINFLSLNSEFTSSFFWFHHGIKY